MFYCYALTKVQVAKEVGGCGHGCGSDSVASPVEQLKSKFRIIIYNNYAPMTILLLVLQVLSHGSSAA